MGSLGRFVGGSQFDPCFHEVMKTMAKEKGLFEVCLDNCWNKLHLFNLKGDFIV